MLYAHEAIELMSAYPGRDFRLGDVIRYVRNGRTLTDKQERAMREAVTRVLRALEEAGSVVVVRPFTNQRGWAYYHWRQMTHADESNPAQTQQKLSQSGPGYCHRA